MRRKLISAKLDPSLIREIELIGKKLYPPNGNKNRVIEDILSERLQKKRPRYYPHI